MEPDPERANPTWEADPGDILGAVDPHRKRTIRLVVALGVAVLLAGALIYTSFSAATEARQPSELLADAKPGESYELTGTVAAGSVRRDGDMLEFRVRDRKGSAAVPVRYTGEIPDPFREGREVIVKGSLEEGRFVAERDSLVTKCPSKFKKKNSQ
jgi:cytochrome c-type biogenesis protein CcmE